jgi:penicillin-binding protein 2
MKSLKHLGFEEISKITPIKQSSQKSHSSLSKADFSSVSWRVLPLYLLLIFAVSSLLISAFFVQIVEGSRNLALSEKNSLRGSFLRAERGVIYDKDGEVVARNRPGFSVELSTKECGDECAKVASEVSRIVHVDIDKIRKLIDEGAQQVTLSSGLTRDQVILVESKLGDLPGVSTQVDPVREYIGGESLAHIIGYIGEGQASEKEGKLGIEKSYDYYLKGELGSRIIQVDSSGTNFTQVAKKDPVPGKNITLYMDKELQEVAYKALKEAVVEYKSPEDPSSLEKKDDTENEEEEINKADPKKKKAKGGAVIATDPNTGGILAMVSLPSFDPNLFAAGISEEDYKRILENPNNPFFNRAISATYPPGSTFKMLTSLAALNEGVITPSSEVNCPSAINVGTFVFRDWYSGGRGPINVSRALQVSCDTFYYTVGGGYGSQKGVGISEIAKLAKEFGFGEKTGVDVEGESGGVFPDPEWKENNIGEQWYLGDTYITSIGQGNILSTPIQINSYTAFFANRGKIYRPQIVKSIEGVREFNPQIKFEKVEKSEYIDAIIDGMHKAVTPGGTAWPLFDFSTRHPGIELAGKTGTAEFGNPVEGGSLRTHAWFTAFGPIEKPSIVVTVLLEEGGGGSDDAAPIAKKVLDEWFKDKLVKGN